MSGGRGSAEARRESAIRPEPIRIAPATKPEGPTAMAAMVGEARKQKRKAIPSTPAARDRQARTLPGPFNEAGSIVAPPGRPQLPCLSPGGATMEPASLKGLCKVLAC